jgi:probable rRNA maturation factor
MIEIEFSNQQSTHSVDAAKLMDAARRILESEGVRRASISIAVVDGPTIRQLNRRFLDHDYPTDTLSFVLEQDAEHLEGETIVCADVAASAAPQFGWSADDELLLYLIHATLHLVGYDDGDEQSRAAMQARERFYLAHYQLAPQDDREPADVALLDTPRDPAQGGKTS